MKTPPIVSSEEWEAARQDLLVKEKAVTRARDALAAERRRMPWLAVDKEYEFEGPEGRASLLEFVRWAPPADRLPGVLRTGRARVAGARVHRMLPGGRPGGPRSPTSMPVTPRSCSRRVRLSPAFSG
jgi:Bacterial protein of unknown function (DUF899)